MSGKSWWQAQSALAHLRAGLKVVKYRDGVLMDLSLAADGVTVIETPVPRRGLEVYFDEFPQIEKALRMNLPLTKVGRHAFSELDAAGGSARKSLK